MKREKKFQTQQTEETQALSQQEFSLGQPREFVHADELLRHDSMHTPVPPSLACRLQDSISAAPAKPRPWWRRLLGL